MRLRGSGIVLILSSSSLYDEIREGDTEDRFKDVDAPDMVCKADVEIALETRFGVTDPDVVRGAVE